MPAQLLPTPAKIPLERPIADCRVYERKECSLRTTCQPASALEMKEMRWAAIIADISQGGVRLVLQRRFEKGTGLAIELPGDGDREAAVVFVKVMHLRSDGNGAWSLGCKFISELSEEEMQRLLTSTNHLLSANEPAGDEELEAPRARYLENVQLLAEGPKGEYVECLIRRLNVTRSWPLTPGKILSINGKTSSHKTWSMRIQVTESVKQGKGHAIQGRIIRS